MKFVNNTSNIKNFTLSIIIPVYNTEKYLPRCLDSIINQTFKNFEIIIVNDCSLGNCKNIVEEYQKKYSNIKYIGLDKNSGTMLARDIGVKNASSEYLMFIDSDDYLIDNNALEELYKECSNDYDIIAFNYICEDVNGKRYSSPPQNKIIENKIIEGGLLSISELFRGSISESLPSKIIKKSLYDTSILISNRHILFQEDYLITLKLLYNARNINLVVSEYYVYFQRDNSSTKFKNMSYEKKKKTLEDLIYVNNEVYKFLKEKNIFEKLKKNIINREYTYKEWMYDEIMLDTDKNQKNELECLFSKAFANIEKNRKMLSLVKTNKYYILHLFGIKIVVKL